MSIRERVSREKTMRTQRRRERSLPVQWDELTGSDFPVAVRKAEGVCLLPIGVLEKHGPHLPVGTDVMVVRKVSIQAAQVEYAVVFPFYYFGQIHEGRHEPGCVAISSGTMTRLLQGVCDEIARNGFEKIVLVNGHGGNTNWLSYFSEIQLEEPRNYTVYIEQSPLWMEATKAIEKRLKTNWGGHACEAETSWVMATRPDLVQLDRAGDEDGRPRRRLKNMGKALSPFWWYADFPHHYAGDPAAANAELGELAIDAWVGALVELVRKVKADKATRGLQTEFHLRAGAPLSALSKNRRRG